MARVSNFKMLQTIIIPDTVKSDNQNGLNWIKTELKKRNIKVTDVGFPEEYSFNEWEKALAPFTKDIGISTIFIAIGGGVPFILKQIELRPITSMGIFLIGGFTGKTGTKEYDNNLIEDINFQEIKKKVMRFFIYNSQDDPLVPIDNGQQLAKNLDTDLFELEDSGHFNKDQSHEDFEEILIDILSIENQFEDE